MTITGNDERDRMIYQAMKTTMGKDQMLSLDNVAALLPGDFDLLPKELVACRHAAKLDSMAPLVTKTPHGNPLAPEPTALQDFPEVEAAPEPTPEEPEQSPDAKLTQRQARAAVEQAAKRLDLARVGVRMARSALQDQRGKLAVAIEAWQNGGPKWTPEMERKAMLQAYKDQKSKTGRVAPRRVANSYVDRAAGAYRGDASDAVRRHPVPNGLNGAPGRKGFRRGAYPSQYQHQKLPSEQ